MDTRRNTQIHISEKGVVGGGETKQKKESIRKEGRKEREKESICMCVGGGRCWCVCVSLHPQLTKGELLRN